MYLECKCKYLLVSIIFSAKSYQKKIICSVCIFVWKLKVSVWEVNIHLQSDCNKNYAHLNRKVPSTQLIWVRPTDPGSLALSRRSYHQWWPMGANLIVDGPELAPVLTGTHLPTSVGWKTEFVQQHEEIRRSTGMTSTGNRAGTSRIVAQRFPHYTTAANVSKRTWPTIIHRKRMLL